MSGQRNTEVCLTYINTNVFGQELEAGKKIGLENEVILSHLLRYWIFFKERLLNIFCRFVYLYLFQFNFVYIVSVTMKTIWCFSESQSLTPKRAMGAEVPPRNRKKP